MKRRFLSILLVMAMLVTGVPATEEKMAKAATALDAGTGSGVNAAVSEVEGIRFDVGNIRYSGDIGNIKWGIDRAGVFAFYHSDATPEKRIAETSGFTTYKDPAQIPWYVYRDHIKYVTLANLDSYISIPSMDYYFSECKNLLAVGMLPAVATSMDHTFYGDVALKSIGCVLPQVQKMNHCFNGCQQLSSVVMTKNPTECTNAFYRTSCAVVVLPGIYDPGSKLATDSKCENYYKMNDFELTLYGISKAYGCTVDDYKSDTRVDPIRYGQSILGAEIGTTGGLRLFYSYGQSTFGHSVYIPCQMTKVLKSPYKMNDVLDAGTHTNMIDVSMQAEPSGVFDAVVPSEFYHTSYKNLVVERCQLGSCVVSVSDGTFTYDGKAKEPEIIINNPYNREVLTKGKDYTVSYQDNVNAGTAKAVLTGIGNYTGTVSKSYTIQKADLSGGVSASGYTGTYDGNTHGIQVSVSKPSNGSTVMYGTSPTNCNLSSSPVYRDVGTYTVYYQVGAANYATYSGSETVRITAKNISACSVAKIADVTYDGRAHTPEPVVSDGTKTLVKGTDYTVSYIDNTNVGTATVTITGKGNYTGTLQTSYGITACPMDGLGEKMVLEKEEMVYTGTERCPGVQIQDARGNVLVENRDYTLVYTDAVNVGTAKVKAVFQGNYSGSITKTFYIKPAVVTDVELSEDEFVYDGKEHKPSADGFLEGVDYQAAYRENINAGTALAIFSFQGNYTGTVMKEFTIRKAQGRLPGVTASCLADGEPLRNSELSWESENGAFSWPDEEILVSTDVFSYPLDFSPNDHENFDWTTVGEWDERTGICRIFCEVTVIANPQASLVRDGDRLALSTLTSDQEGASYEWEDPDIIVKRSENGANAYPAVYHYEGKSIVRLVTVPIQEEPEPTLVPAPTMTPESEKTPVPTENPTEGPTISPTPDPAGKPTNTAKPSETALPTDTALPTENPTVRPTTSPTPDPAAKPSNTALPTENPTKRPTIPPSSDPSQVTPEQPDAIEKILDSEELNGPSAYEMIDQYISAKLLAGENTKLGMKEIKAGSSVSSRASVSKIKVRWIVKQNTVIRLKKGKRLHLRIKGISKKKKLPWCSKHKKVVSVNKKGVIKAKKKGRAKITVKVGKKTYVCRIKVKK